MAKTKPFFSIIIPALNEARYLPHLLNDLVAQTYQDFEVIVVDGHSDDSTVVQAKKFSRSLPHLRVVNSSTRHVCVQRNLGAKHAHAETLVFMDADNRLPPYFFQGVKYRLEQSQAQLLSTWIIPSIHNRTYDLFATAINYSFELQSSLKPLFLLEAMVIITRQAFATVKGFPEDVDYAEGVQFTQTAFKHGIKTVFVRDPSYTFSFRRIQKAGILRFLSNLTQLSIVKLTDEHRINQVARNLYPMQGGRTHQLSYRQKQRFLTTIKKFLQDL